MSGESDFLSRWSRMKRQGETAEPDQEPSVPEPETAAPDERTDDEILSDLGLKHPDSLEPGDDIRGFMQAAVPDRLRRLALRQLWRTKPELAVLDGLVEYGEDYTDAATVVANLQTAYRVGKGILRDDVATEEPEPVAAVETADPAAAAAAETEADAEPDAPPADETGETAPGHATAVERDEEGEDGLDGGAADPGPTRRRMAFRFTND